MAVWEIVKSENGSVDRVDGGGFDTWDMRGHYIGIASTIAQAWAMIHQANFERYGATTAVEITAARLKWFAQNASPVHKCASRISHELPPVCNDAASLSISARPV